MTKMKALVCRECAKEYPTKAIHVCEMCFGPLEVKYNYEEIKKSISRKKILDGPLSMWRYVDLLPVEGTNFVGPHAGLTPLVRAKNLGAYLGLDELYIKNDTVNHPTLSFKDRVVAVALTRARELGFETVACASTGNLANSVSAHAADVITVTLDQAKIITLPDGAFIMVAQDTSRLLDMQRAIEAAFAWAGGLTLLLAIVGGWLLSGNFLRRIDTIGRTSRAIMEGDLTARIPVRGTNDEIDQLVASLNAMLDRIQQLLDGVRQVSSDIAHDLRTPLGRLRQNLEDARDRATTTADYETATEAAIVFPKDFVIPGSSKASSAIELARTIIRRAERWCVTLGREGLLPGDHLLAYMNRLADLLWLLARQAETLEASATRSVSQTPVRD